MSNDPKQSTLGPDVSGDAAKASRSGYERVTGIESGGRVTTNREIKTAAGSVTASRTEGTISVRLVPAFSRSDDPDTSH